MRAEFLLVAVLLTSCSHSPTGGASKVTPQPATVSGGGQIRDKWNVHIMGVPYQLRFGPGVFTFCDDRGGEKLDLANGDQQPDTALQCIRRQDDQSGCGDDALGIFVSSPDMNREPNDRITIGSNNYWLKGRADACANDGLRIIAGSGSQVVVIDGMANRVAIVDSIGADQVAIGSGWVAWKPWNDKSVQLVSQASALSIAKKQ